MTQEKFFRKIQATCFNEREYLVELLKLRGFLIDECDGELCLSDNAHKQDAKYLNELLVKYDLGIIINDVITLNDCKNVFCFEKEFAEGISIGGEACIEKTSWSWFKHREHGEKIAVSLLEPYIARYIKAISTCCVMTAGSCDGNHPLKDRMFIQLTGSGSRPWHRFICEKFLGNNYRIAWINDYTTIAFTNDSKYDTYYELNRAANYIYENRIKLRRIKNLALSDMTPSYFRHHTSEEIELEFISKANQCFDRIFFE